MSGRLLWIAALLEQLAREWWQARRRRKRWPTLAALVRACPSCGEIAYTPKQTHCYRCGAVL